jgi:hypothetical protein
LDVLNAGEMPPEDEPQSPQADLIGVIGLLTDSLYDARRRLAEKSHTPIRQLNRREYQNTIRDLLGVHIETDSLPEDGTLDGFDTVGDVQYMSATQFEEYLPNTIGILPVIPRGHTLPSPNPMTSPPPWPRHGRIRTSNIETCSTQAITHPQPTSQFPPPPHKLRSV